MKLMLMKQSSNSLFRFEQFEGKEHLVLPMIMITVGVHNGVYYPEEELKRIPDSWNGRPVTVNHPEEGSANTPHSIEKRSIGRIFNCVFDDKLKALKAEAWIDVEKCNSVSPNLLSSLVAGDKFDVSTGLFVQDVIEDGEWNGEKYGVIGKNYIPDHLAVLPNSEGACSWSDGAGIPRINSKKPVSQIQKTNTKEMSMDKKAMLEKMLEKKLFSPESIKSLEALSDAEVKSVFEKLTAEPVVNDTNKTTEPVKNTVEPAVQKIAEPVKNTVEPAVQKTAEVITVNSYVANAPKEIQDVLLHGLKAHQQAKDTLIAGIKLNKKNKFSDAELNTFSLEFLQSVHALAVTENHERPLTNNASVQTQNSVPTMPSISFETK